MVMDVSAILVANTIFRTPTGGLCNKVHENSQLNRNYTINGKPVHKQTEATVGVGCKFNANVKKSNLSNTVLWLNIGSMEWSGKTRNWDFCKKVQG